MKQNWQFFVLTWLIFAGLVTYIPICSGGGATVCLAIYLYAQVGVATIYLGIYLQYM